MSGSDEVSVSRAVGRLRRVLPGVADLTRYRRQWLRPDVLAGLAVWAVVVPQGLAYGELAGLSPVAGLYTALGALLLYPLLGSSRYLHPGPESSISIVTAAYIGGLVAGSPERAASLAALLALVTAGFLALGAVLRLGVVARLLSTPVLAGYLTGSAVVIAAGQLGKIFAIPTPAADWWDKLIELFTNLPETNPRALLVGVGTLVAVVALLRWTPKLPGILLAIAAATAVVSVVGWEGRLPVIGEVPSGIPVPSLPHFGVGDAVDLLGAGASVALLVFASSMLTASALARRDREPISPRREFIGLAAASVGSALLSGYPATASNSRSFMVADSRARSQVANLTAALLVVVTLLLLTPVFQYLPQAALGAVVLVAAVRMIDIAALHRLWSVRRSDFVLAAVTAAGVLVVGVLPGIGVGVAVSLLEVLRRALLPPTAVLGRLAGHDIWRSIDGSPDMRTVPGLLVYRFDAPLFFANSDVLREEVVRLVDRADPPAQLVIIDAEGMVDMDITGAEALDRLLDELEERGTRLVLARVRASLRTTLRRLGIEERLGAENFHLRIRDAVAAFRPAATEDEEP
jgi:SulP family sulfate permease